MHWFLSDVGQRWFWFTLFWSGIMFAIATERWRKPTSYARRMGSLKTGMFGLGAACFAMGLSVLLAGTGHFVAAWALVTGALLVLLIVVLAGWKST